MLMKCELDYRKLYEEACAARAGAYAPYSGFMVGAVLLCEDGTIIPGCNVENASYSATNCAERTAFFSAAAAGKREFHAIGIVGGLKDDTCFDFCPPCGVCLQVMAEFCHPEEFTVILFNSEGAYREYRLAELLPRVFRLE